MGNANSKDHDVHLWNNLWNTESPILGARPKPKVHAKCSTIDEVVAKLQNAVDQGLSVRTRSTGHHCAALAIPNGGCCIDVGEMKTITVDVPNGIAKIQPGVKSGPLYQTVSQHNLLFNGGHISDVGCTGFSIGGGCGWGMREAGFACEQVLGAQVVIVDANKKVQVVEASPTSNPDLLWALRGGGAFMGIVTELTVHCCHFGGKETIRTAIVQVPLQHVPAAWALYNKSINDTSTPPGLHNMCVVNIDPEGNKGCVIAMYNYCIDKQQHADANVVMDKDIKELESMCQGKCVLDQELSFVDACASQDQFGDFPGQSTYNSSFFMPLENANQEFMDVVLKHWSKESTSCASGIVMSPTRLDTPPADRMGAFGDRSNRLWVEILTSWKRSDQGPKADGDEQHINWANEIYKDLSQWVEVSYLNNSMVIDGGKSDGKWPAQQVTKKSCFFPAEWAKLKELKAKWDPCGVFLSMDD